MTDQLKKRSNSNDEFLFEHIAPVTVLSKEELKKLYPKTIWIAFLNGNIWAWGDSRGGLDLKSLSPEDTRLEIKQFVEVTP
jgi:hypothetical protein